MFLAESLDLKEGRVMERSSPIAIDKLWSRKNDATLVFRSSDFEIYIQIFKVYFRTIT